MKNGPWEPGAEMASHPGSPASIVLVKQLWTQPVSGVGVVMGLKREKRRNRAADACAGDFRYATLSCGAPRAGPENRGSGGIDMGEDSFSKDTPLGNGLKWFHNGFMAREPKALALAGVFAILVLMGLWRFVISSEVVAYGHGNYSIVRCCPDAVLRATGIDVGYMSDYTEVSLGRFSHRDARQIAADINKACLCATVK